MYRIIDIQTKKQVGAPYANRNRARTRAEKLNLEYGAHRYTAMPVSWELV